MLRTAATLCAVSMLLGWTASARAGDCPGNPDALGTSRVITVDPTEHPRVGTMQYQESLPLADKEVVLTFDDGPVSVYTDRILDALAAECVKATFFIVGRQARAYPAEVRKAYNAGHTIGSHSQNHPLIFTRLSIGGARQEIDRGVASVTAALGDSRALAPFFRFPGLGRSRAIEGYLATRGIMAWSTDVLADDWTHIGADEVMKRAIERLERRGRGILLLHDIQPATALMLPQLLRTLRERGFHIVQVIPTGVDRPKTVTEPDSWVMRKPKPAVWPMVLERTAMALPAPSMQSFGWPRPFWSRSMAPMRVAPDLVHGSPGIAEDRAHAMEPVAPVETFAAVAEVNNEPGFSRDDPGPSLVVPDVTIASMIAPAAASMHPKHHDRHFGRGRLRWR